MSETQVTLRFPRAFSRLCAPQVGGMNALVFGAFNIHFRQQVPGSLAFTRAGRLSPAWGSPRFLPACLPPCVRRPSCPGPRPPDLIGALRVGRRISHPLGSVPPSASFRVFQRAAPPSTSPPVSTPRSKQVAPPVPFGKSQPATRSFRPRGLAPPRRFSPPMARGLVASHCRSWGSPGFNRVSPPRKARFPPVSPPTPYPPELSPPAQPYPHSCWPLPSCRSGLRPWCYQGPSTSRPCSARASVVVNLRCRSSTPDALLGFPVSEAPRTSSLLTYANRSRRPLGPRSPLGGSEAGQNPYTADVRSPKAPREV